MARNYNTNVSGGAFTLAEINSVWNKGVEIPGYPKDTWRRDMCGNSMKRDEHGDRNSSTGWEIDHIKPVEKGGTDDLSNLQPLYWGNNAVKADKYPWRCGE